MSRNDNILYTGTTSRTFAPQTQKTTEDRQNAQREERTQLKPAAQVVLNALAAEKNHVNSIDSFDVTEANVQNHLIEMLARKRYYEYLKQLEIKMTNILREPKK